MVRTGNVVASRGSSPGLHATRGPAASGFLHRRVCCEPDFLDQGAENFAELVAGRNSELFPGNKRGKPLSLG